MSKLYIAYGSNLNLRQMASRCPTATIYGTGVLDNWELLFRGQPHNAHATIERSKECHVPVLVWEVQDKDEKRLDRYEGYPVYYYKDYIPVYVDGKGKVEAMVYIMDRSQKPGYPSDSYVQTIRRGYKDCRFSMDYLDAVLEKNMDECRDLKFRIRDSYI